MNNRLYVGSLPYAIKDADLAQIFSQVGTVVSATVITEGHSGRSKGFGFVEMSSPEEATRAIEELNGKTVGERTIIVSLARPPERREGGSGGRGGNGGRGGRGGFGGNRDRGSRGGFGGGNRGHYGDEGGNY